MATFRLDIYVCSVVFQFRSFSVTFSVSENLFHMIIIQSKNRCLMLSLSQKCWVVSKLGKMANHSPTCQFYRFDSELLKLFSAFLHSELIELID